MKSIKKIVVGFIGSTILFVGILLIFLPGPAIIMIPLGLGILATEFKWAKTLLRKFKRRKSNKTPQ